ncbi:PPR containing protein, putative [Medicago truncatula]|uniref:PPR containing protein, putative n=1 Tax=Medicago truncatula TaxID=3880 RepID=G7IWV5_MEDTR|nr:PPR containing protein, putative [Medicago truncatula]
MNSFYEYFLIRVGNFDSFVEPFQPKEVSQLYETMLFEGLKPTVDVFIALASAYDMKSVADRKPDVYTYSVLISCCPKFRRFDLIERVLVDMSYLGIECNNVTYKFIDMMIKS